jgi:hypothetical protein
VKKNSPIDVTGKVTFDDTRTFSNGGFACVYSGKMEGKAVSISICTEFDSLSNSLILMIADAENTRLPSKSCSAISRHGSVYCHFKQS